MPDGERPATRCAGCGTDDILDDRTGLCIRCHIATATSGQPERTDDRPIGPVSSAR